MGLVVTARRENLCPSVVPLRIENCMIIDNINILFIEYIAEKRVRFENVI